MAKARKLPKRIAGVKIPKRLRKAGAPLHGVLSNPMARTIAADMIAAGLIAAADAIARSEPAKAAGKKAKHAAESAGEAAAGAAAAGAVNVRSVLALVAREAAKAIKAGR